MVKIFWASILRPFTGERIVLLTMILEKMDIHNEKKEVSPSSNILHKCKLKMKLDLNVIPKTILEENKIKIFMALNSAKLFGYASKNTGNEIRQNKLKEK